LARLLLVDPAVNTNFGQVASALKKCKFTFCANPKSERFYLFATNTLDNNLNGLIFFYNKAKPVVWQRYKFSGLLKQPSCLYYGAASAFLFGSAHWPI
jgi:hypothetical protein